MYQDSYIINRLFHKIEELVISMCNDQDFTNKEWVINETKKYLDKARVMYEEENPDPENVIFQFQVKAETASLQIIIGQLKELPHQLDVVSVVKFSPEHIKALELISEEEKAKMISGIFQWLTPREPEYELVLTPPPDEKEALPYYYVRMGIYEGDLSLGNLMRATTLVMKSSAIARKIIQDILNKHVMQEEEK